MSLSRRVTNCSYSRNSIRVTANTVYKAVKFDTCVMIAGPAICPVLFEDCNFSKDCTFIYDGMGVDIYEWLGLIERRTRPKYPDER